MKKTMLMLSLLLALTSVVTSCGNDEEQNVDQNLVGSWNRLSTIPITGRMWTLSSFRIIMRCSKSHLRVTTRETGKERRKQES